MHVQFVWKGAPGVFEGKKLTYQNKWSLETRSWSEAQSKVNALEKRLKDFAEGNVVPKGMTVEAALQEWYEFREQNGSDNTKAKLMRGKLVEGCEKNNILLLTALNQFGGSILDHGENLGTEPPDQLLRQNRSDPSHQAAAEGPLDPLDCGFCNVLQMAVHDVARDCTVIDCEEVSQVNF